mmetsp:Transcript_101308/g.269345  ORF Transcript_101308/g.269345 Transcript_101308/m.269345 type:complete len:200 (-) Transcript_101308:458-1057(-)
MAAWHNRCASSFGSRSASSACQCAPAISSLMSPNNHARRLSSALVRPELGSMPSAAYCSSRSFSNSFSLLIESGNTSAVLCVQPLIVTLRSVPEPSSDPSNCCAVPCVQPLVMTLSSLPEPSSDSSSCCARPRGSAAARAASLIQLPKCGNSRALFCRSPTDGDEDLATMLSPGTPPMPPCMPPGPPGMPYAPGMPPPP